MMKFSTDSCGPQAVNPDDFGEPLTFYLLHKQFEWNI